MGRSVGVLVIFSLATVVFFWRFFWGGLIPIPGDLMIGAYYPWLGQKWGYIVGVPVKNPMASDVISQFYPWRRTVIERVRAGELPLWDRSNYLGLSLIGNVQAAIFNPFNLIFLAVADFNVAWGWQVVIQPWLAMVCMYVLLRTWRRSRQASIIGSLGYAFSGTMIVWLEYNVHGFVFAVFPLVFYCLYQARYRDSRFWLGLGPLFAFILFAGYPQLLYYTMGFAFLYNLFLCVRLGDGGRKRCVGLIWFSLVLVLGIGLGAVQLFPAMETLKQSIRDVDKVAQVFKVDKLPVNNLVMGIIPDFFGNPATYNYWGGGTYESFTFYTSIVALVLAGLSLWRVKKNSEVGFLWGMLALTLLLALSTPLTSWIQTVAFLGLRGSTAVRGLFVYGFSVSCLSAFGFDEVGSFRQKLRKRMFVVLGGMAIGGVVLALLGMGFWPVLLNAHTSVALRNAFLPIAVGGLSAVLIVAWQRKSLVLGMALAALLFLDMFRFGEKYLSYTRKDLIFPRTPTTDFLMEQIRPFRIAIQRAELLPSNSWSMYGLESVSGYDILVPKATAQFINYLNSSAAAEEYARFADVRNFGSKLLNISDTKYVVYLEKENGVAFDPGSGRYKKVFDEGKVGIWENTQNLGRYYSVEKYLTVNGEAVYGILVSEEFDPRRAVLLEEDPGVSELGKCSTLVLSYEAGQAKVETNCSGDSLLVISEPYDSGWRVFVNGGKSDIYRANGRFMAVEVPQGRAEVMMKYYPAAFFWGAGVSAVSFVVWCLALVVWGRNCNCKLE